MIEPEILHLLEVFIIRKPRRFALLPGAKRGVESIAMLFGRRGKLRPGSFVS